MYWTDKALDEQNSCKKYLNSGTCVHIPNLSLVTINHNATISVLQNCKGTKGNEEAQ